jgi:hypothetical protein
MNQPISMEPLRVAWARVQRGSGGTGVASDAALAVAPLSDAES